MNKRRRFTQSESLTDRLATFAKLMRERAATLSSASDKNSVLAKANQADRAADMDRWISSYELKPPK
ncbi:MAG: hypothetical protein J0H25_02345 [Rhizobiales bacterium]|nr:hypothetical protein [Hyphomicrobiales bacterium]